MNERKWIVIEPGNSSLSAYEISKKVIYLLRHSQTVQREDDGAVQFWKIKNFLHNFHTYLIGRMIVGKHAWQQEEEHKRDISTALMCQRCIFGLIFILRSKRDNILSNTIECNYPSGNTSRLLCSKSCEIENWRSLL